MLRRAFLSVLGVPFIGKPAVSAYNRALILRRGATPYTITMEAVFYGVARLCIDGHYTTAVYGDGTRRTYFFKSWIRPSTIKITADGEPFRLYSSTFSIPQHGQTTE